MAYLEYERPKPFSLYYHPYKQRAWKDMAPGWVQRPSTAASRAYVVLSTTLKSQLQLPNTWLGEKQSEESSKAESQAPS